MSASAIADVQMSGALSQTDRGLAASRGRRSSLLGSSWETAPALGRFLNTSLRRKRVSYCFWAKPRAHGVQVIASSNLAAPTKDSMAYTIGGVILLRGKRMLG